VSTPRQTHNCCRDFTRSQLIRSAAAEAGRGLPAVEAGVPTPAGTGLTRRKFLSRSAGMALAVYGASRLPIGAFEEGIAQAAQNDRILVSVYLEGGIDAMSVLAPVGDSRYAALRPTLALTTSDGTPFSEDTRLRWHPSAAALATLHSEGKVSAFPAIGYDSPNQSHFTSRHFYEIGETEVGFRTGWMGRYLDLRGDDENPLQGLSLDGELSPTLATVSKPVAAIDSVTNYNLWARVDEPVSDEMFRSFSRFGSFPSDSAAMKQARQATSRTETLREQLKEFDSFTSPVPYPNSYFANNLSGLAAMIAVGLPLHCVTIGAVGGYDTHSDQTEGFNDDLQRTCDAILAFQRDLEARGLADRVLIEIWSEFGRRPRENGSLGTDHGAAGCAFVVGSKARGQMVGEFPGLANLDDDDNLLHTSDFRSMYCSLLEQWLGQDAAAVIPGASGFARPSLVKP
jgi:uncharacterized protein (DUF1501 family)